MQVTATVHCAPDRLVPDGADIIVDVTGSAVVAEQEEAGSGAGDLR